MQGLAGDERSVVAEEEADGGRELVSRAHPLHRLLAGRRHRLLPKPKWCW